MATTTPLDGRIVAHAEYGAHIALTCVNHPHLRWHTKNIGGIGCRSLFFASFPELECLCKVGDLVPLAAGEV